MPDFHISIYFPNTHLAKCHSGIMQTAYMNGFKILLENHLISKYMFDPFLKHRWAFLFIKKLILSGDRANLEKNKNNSACLIGL